MKQLLILNFILFSFILTSYAQDLTLKEIEVKLDSPQTFQENKIIEIAPKTPLPIYGKATGLCFELGEPFPAGKNLKEQKERMKAQLIKAFGNIQIADAYLPIPSVAKITITDESNKKSELSASMSPAWDFLSQMGIFTENIHDNYGRFSVCSRIEKNNDPIIKIQITPLQSFTVKSVYWESSDIIEKTKSP